MGRPHQTHRPRQSRGPLVPPAGCRFAPTPGSGCFSGRCEPHPGTIPRLVHRVVVPPGLALIAIPELRKRRLRRRIGLRMARPRRQPPQLHPVPQPVGARQAAFNRKLVFQYSLRVDPTKRDHTIPRQLGASDNPILEPRARHGVDPWLSTRGCRPVAVDPWLSTRARPVAQSLKAILFIAVVPLVGRRPAQTSQPRRFLMLHPLEHVGDHQNPLAHARSRVVPSAAAPPPPVRCERSMPASSIPPNMVHLPNHSTTSGDHRKSVLKASWHNIWSASRRWCCCRSICRLGNGSR